MFLEFEWDKIKFSIKAQSNFICIKGNSGLGKTLLLNCIKEYLEYNKVKVFLINSSNSFDIFKDVVENNNLSFEYILIDRIDFWIADEDRAYLSEYIKNSNTKCILCSRLPYGFMLPLKNSYILDKIDNIVQLKECYNVKFF